MVGRPLNCPEHDVPLEDRTQVVRLEGGTRLHLERAGCPVPGCREQWKTSH